MSRGRRVGWIAGGVLGAAVVAVGVAYAVTGADVPRDTTVEGVAIGGLDPAAARERLRAGLEPKAERPIEVSVDGTRGSVAGDKAGLSVDYAASVREAGGGRSLSPVRLWHHLVGGGEHPAILNVDHNALRAALGELSASIGKHAVEGTVTFADGVATPVPGRSGTGVDPDRGAEMLEDAFLRDDPVVLPVTTVEPTIGQSAVDRAMSEFAEPALSGPVVIKVPGAKAVAPPRLFSNALSMRAEDGALVPVVDGAKLLKVLEPVMSSIGAEPKDAGFEVRNGKPRVVPARVGASLDPEALAGRFPAALTKPKGERIVELDTETVEPEFTTADAKALGIKERVSTFTTYFPYAAYRNVNLSRAAELIDGTVLKPGETFSLNGIVGERTRENGFTTGYVIKDGLFREDLGGGVSQIATTTFNAMFFAGLKDVQHKPHSVYIDRYPEGREATVAWPSLDLKFTNDTPYGVLVKAHVAKSAPGGRGSATVSMYSTKHWEITTTKGGRYAYTKPKLRYLDAPDCEPAGGSSGFSVDVLRHFAKASDPKTRVRTEKFHTVYIPADSVKCGKPPKEKDQAKAQ